MLTTFAIEQPIPTAAEILEKYIALRATFLATQIDANVVDAIARQTPTLFWCFRHTPRWLHRLLARIVRLRIEQYYDPAASGTTCHVFAFSRQLSTFTISDIALI
jgi:hypothetical protein